MTTYVPVTHKFVAVLNKKVPVGQLMNALGHMTAGLAASYPNAAEMRFDNYEDGDGNAHANISDNPFIVLQADNSNKLRTFRQALQEAGLPCVDFTSTMTEGTYAEQQERTKVTPEAELEYWGVVTFGEIEKLNALTKKFSLWRS
jgi:hypothetical protein